MGATLDSKGKSFFLAGNTNLIAGATALDLPTISPCNEEAQINDSIYDLDNSRYTWLVCPHLTESERVYEYYMSSGLIIIVLGKCFCEDCLDMILFNSDLSDFVKSSRPMHGSCFLSN
jgi:hypothetical protein